MTNALYHVFAKDELKTELGTVAKDTIIEVHPIKEDYINALFVIEGKEVELKYRDVMDLESRNGSLSVVGNRVPKSSNFDRFGFPVIDLAKLAD